MLQKRRQSATTFCRSGFFKGALSAKMKFINRPLAQPFGACPTNYVFILCIFSIALMILYSSSSFKLPACSFDPIIDNMAHGGIRSANCRQSIMRHSIVKGSMAKSVLQEDESHYHPISEVSRSRDADDQLPQTTMQGTSGDNVKHDGNLPDVQAWQSSVEAKGSQRMINGHELANESPNNMMNGISKNTCEGNRVYMYELPAEFNTDILKGCKYGIADWLNFCPHKDNEGFGRKLDNSVDDGNNQWQDWFASDPYMLEVIFHHRMLHYPCLTKEPLQADAFFIPYYSGLDALHYLYGKNMTHRASQGSNLVSWLSKNAHTTWMRHGGHDHFIVMGRTVWDFVRPLEVQEGWGTSFRELEDMKNVTALFLEKRPWVWNDQAIPYPTAFHPTSMESLAKWQSKVRASPRPKLFAFVGAPRSGQQGSIRQAVLEQCMNASSTVVSQPLPSLSMPSSSPSLSSGCTLVDCQQLRCAHNPKPIAESLLQAQFCLQPPGDTPTRRSTFDGMLSGCIPVFFHEDSAYSQYHWHLPEDSNKYSVYIKEKDLYKLEEVLGSYGLEEIQEMREAIIELIPRFIYMSSKAVPEMSMKDAFDITVERMTNRVSEIRRRGWH